MLTLLGFDMQKRNKSSLKISYDCPRIPGRIFALSGAIAYDTGLDAVLC